MLRRTTTIGDEDKNMAKAISNLPGIEQFIINENGTISIDKRWEIWRVDFELYQMATGVTQEAQKKALLLHLAGKDIKEIYKLLKLCYC